MYKQNKSQSSMEFLFIFGIGLALILIMSALFFNFFTEEKNTLDKEHMQKLGEKLMMTAEEIYYGGTGVRITINTIFPEGIYNMSINHTNYTDSLGQTIEYDYLIFDYVDGVDLHKMIFEPFDVGVRFNCTMCYNDSLRNISWYNEEDFGSGSKKIRLENKGDYISIDFSKYYEEGVDTSAYNFN